MPELVQPFLLEALSLPKREGWLLAIGVISCPVVLLASKDRRRRQSYDAQQAQRYQGGEDLHMQGVHTSWIRTENRSDWMQLQVSMHGLWPRPSECSPPLQSSRSILAGRLAPLPRHQTRLRLCAQAWMACHPSLQKAVRWHSGAARNRVIWLFYTCNISRMKRHYISRKSKIALSLIACREWLLLCSLGMSYQRMHSCHACSVYGSCRCHMTVISIVCSIGDEVLPVVPILYDARMMHRKVRGSRQPGSRSFGLETSFASPKKVNPLPTGQSISPESTGHAASWRTARTSFEPAAGVSDLASTPFRVLTCVQTLCLGEALEGRTAE